MCRLLSSAERVGSTCLVNNTIASHQQYPDTVWHSRFALVIVVVCMLLICQHIVDSVEAYRLHQFFSRRQAAYQHFTAAIFCKWSFDIAKPDLQITRKVLARHCHHGGKIVIIIGMALVMELLWLISLIGVHVMIVGNDKVRQAREWCTQWCCDLLFLLLVFVQMRRRPEGVSCAFYKKQAQRLIAIDMEQCVPI